MRAFRKAVLFILTLALLAVPFLVYFKAQALTDWWQLRDYTPPSSIASLASQDSMTDYARRVFYVNHPALETDAAKFRADCSQSEKTIVLGCYRSNQNGIFIFNVSDARLAGVQQVTAAHELLHAAYDRLGSKDRDNLDGLLQGYYAQLTDQRIIDTINAYKESEPNDVVNEMHSVFGTEIAGLPPALEAYYAKYFTNRQAVTAFASSYQNEFTARSDQINADDAQLARLKALITQQEQSLQTQAAQIEADRERLDSLRGAGQIEQYNAGVAGFNARVSAYNAGVARLKRDIAAYNQLVAERNSIAAELANLAKALDTRLAPQAAQ